MSLFDSNKKPETPEEWSKSAPWLTIGMRVYDEESQVFYSKSPTGEAHFCVFWQAPPMLGASNATLDKLKSSLSMSLNPGSFVQFGSLMHDDVEPYLDLYLDGKIDCENPLLLDMAKRRYQMMMDAKNKPLLANGVHAMTRILLITLKVPVRGIDDEQGLESIIESAERLESSLKTVGLKADRLDNSAYLGFMRKLHNPFHKREDWHDDERPLNEQIFQPGDKIKYERNHIEFSSSEDEKWYAKLLSVKFFPKKASIALMNYVIGDPSGMADQMTNPHWISMTVHYPDQVKKASSIQRRFAMITHQAFGPTINMIPLLGHKKRGMDVLVNSIDNGGGSVVETNFSVWLFHKDLNRLKQFSSSVTTYYSTLGFDMKEDGMLLEPMWTNCLPGEASSESIKATHRYHTMTIKHAIQFLPIIGEWQGSGPSGVLTFTTRRGSPTLFDLYESTSQSGLIFAEPGMGKSVLTQLILRDYLAEGARAWAIDTGYSYFKLCHAVGGEFLKFDETSRVSLNPFTNVIDIEDDIEMIKAMVAKMAAPVEGFDDYRMAALEEAIMSVWTRYAQSASITAIAEFCLNQPEQRIKDIGKQLFPFTRMGSYGRWFEGPNNVDLSNFFVVLELEELKDQPVLQNVILIQLMSRIGYEMYRTASGKKLFILDEAWVLLADPVMLKAIDAAIRKVRKYKGSMIIVTQSIGDLYATPMGSSIARNASWQFILGQKEESIDVALDSKQFSLDSYGVRMLKMVHTSPGDYSEVMIRRSTNEWGVVRIILDDFEKAMFSTSGDEREFIMAEMNKGRNVVEVINELLLMQQKPKEVLS
jgi:conjugal transfer ATP-binding protein TraC